MSNSDTRTDELLTVAINMLDLDIENCSQEELKEIPNLLKVLRSAHRINFTDVELETVRKELEWMK